MIFCRTRLSDPIGNVFAAGQQVACWVAHAWGGLPRPPLPGHPPHGACCQAQTVRVLRRGVRPEQQREAGWGCSCCTTTSASESDLESRTRSNICSINGESCACVRAPQQAESERNSTRRLGVAKGK